MASFASRLANRIQANSGFQADYAWLCANGIAALTQNPDLLVATPEMEDGSLRITRLIESASCLAMDENARSHKVAQTIALYGVASNSEPNISAACEHILAQLGNFPAAAFVRQLGKFNDNALPTVVHVRDFARRHQNTVKLPNGRLPLTDFQLDIWDDLEVGKSAAISAPTSAGKSFVVRQFIVQKIKATRSVQVAYIVPTRSLMAEIQQKLSDELGHDDMTLRVTSVPVEDTEKRSRQVFVVTQERLLAYLDEAESVKFDYVVVDEAQQMGDGSRGMILQDCLERINEANPKCIQYFMAPMASRVDHLAAAVGRMEISTHVTEESPVVSTKIVVKLSSQSGNELILEMIDAGERTTVARLRRDYGFADRRHLLASVCIELGSAGGSLVYASGQADAEAVALQIAIDRPESSDAALQELAQFIRSDVHKDYSLAFCVLRGVGFHYGSMPTLLREALEDAFRSGALSFLACTTTLFQGVNLPARNVFIDKVKRGTRGALKQEDIWNFVGRAGRLKHDVAGNVFLVDYDSWPEQLMDSAPHVNVQPALTKILASGRHELERFLEQAGETELRDEEKRNLEAAAGLLLSRYRKGNYPATIQRCAGQLGIDAVNQLEMRLVAALAELNIPPMVLDRNWQISPWRLEAMYTFLSRLVRQDQWREYCPSHPMLAESYGRYEKMFCAIEEYLRGKQSDKWARYLNYQAMAWMKGATICSMIDKELEHNPPRSKRKSNALPNSNSAVRKVFELVEKQLRFTYVQMTRAYCDCLKFALVAAGLHEDAEKVFPVSLALELGACSKTMVSLIELGLSRISAQTLSNYMRGSDLSSADARTWLRSRRDGDLPISRIVLDELARLRLLRTD